MSLNTPKVNLSSAGASEGLKTSEHLLPSPWALIVSLALKILISGAAVYYILDRLRSDGFDWQMASMSVVQSFLDVKFLVPAFLLMALNWSVEAHKWYLLLTPVFRTPWRTAMKGVLTGSTFGLFTSNRGGEFIGRVLALGPGRRISGSLISLVNGAAQSMATLSFGFLAVGVMVGQQEFGMKDKNLVLVVQVSLLLAWLAMVFAYFRFGSAFRWAASNWNRLRPFRFALRHIHAPLLHRLFGLSVLRYVFFVLQYLLVFHALNVTDDLVSVAVAAMLTMLGTTVLSALPVPDVLMRGGMALVCFQVFDIGAGPVAEAVTLVWILNVALPAVIGAVLIFTYRLFR